MKAQNIRSRINRLEGMAPRKFAGVQIIGNVSDAEQGRLVAECAKAHGVSPEAVIVVRRVIVRPNHH